MLKLDFRVVVCKEGPSVSSHLSALPYPETFYPIKRTPIWPFKGLLQGHCINLEADKMRLRSLKEDALFENMSMFHPDEETSK